MPTSYGVGGNDWCPDTAAPLNQVLDSDSVKDEEKDVCPKHVARDVKGISGRQALEQTHLWLRAGESKLPVLSRSFDRCGFSGKEGNLNWETE